MATNSGSTEAWTGGVKEGSGVGSREIGSDTGNSKGRSPTGVPGVAEKGPRPGEGRGPKRKTRRLYHCPLPQGGGAWGAASNGGAEAGRGSEPGVEVGGDGGDASIKDVDGCGVECMEDS